MRKKGAQYKKDVGSASNAAGRLFLSWFGVSLPSVKPRVNMRPGSPAGYRDHEHLREISRHSRQRQQRQSS
jgi:hypothetical protein